MKAQVYTLAIVVILFSFVAQAQNTNNSKIHRLNFTGIELGQEVGYYHNSYGVGLNDMVTAAAFERYLPTNSQFYNYFDKTTYNQNSNPYYNNWSTQSDAVSLTALLSFGNKGKSAINKHHQLRLGIGYGNRMYNAAEFSTYKSFGVDTIGMDIIQNDTVYIMTDSISKVSSTLSPIASMGLLSIGYLYTISPADKVTLSFGGGLDIGLGSLSVATFIKQTNDRKYYGFGYGADTTVWQYAIQHYGLGVQPQVTILENSINRGNIAYLFRPYLAARLSYRLSKKQVFFRHMNLFAEGRVGWEYANAAKLADRQQKRYVSLRFGITYNLNKLFGS